MSINITIKSSYFTLGDVDEDGKYFTVTESIGFSEGDLLQGFNRYNTSYVDANGDAYPRLDEAVLVIYAYRNRYDSDTIEYAQLLTSLTREPDTDTTGDYSNIAYVHEISIPGDGWFVLYPMLIPVSSTDGVYYDTSSGQFINAGAGEDESSVVAIEDLINQDDVYSLQLHAFRTPASERRLNDQIGDLTDMAILKGSASKEYKDKLRTVQYMEALLSGAYVKFNDSYMAIAQKIIEDLETLTTHGE